MVAAISFYTTSYLLVAVTVARYRNMEGYPLAGKGDTARDSKTVKNVIRNLL